MASELILILADFFSRGDHAHSDATLPRLPALESLLAMARRDPLPQGWRGALAWRSGGAELAALAPAAAVALAQLDARAQTALQYWLATPVHWFAGLDSVHLHPSGLLQLPADSQAALVADFSSVFGDAPWRLHALGARELLLSGAPLAAGAEDPARFVGRDVRAGLPAGTAAATLRRLGAEIEMWLHGHRINVERQARGELPVSALWLWGAQPPDKPAEAGRALAMLPNAARFYGRDTYAEALWRLRAGRPEAVPEQFQSMAHAGGATDVVLYPTLGSDGLGAVLERFEQCWLQPAMQALRARELSVIELLAGSHAYRLSRLNLTRFWRKRSPWWESLA